MELKNISYIDCAAATSHRIRAGFAYTDASTYAGPGVGLADANGYASGRDTSVTTVTYTSARTTPYSRHSEGNASANAYGTNGSRSDSSHAVSASRYRETSMLGHITASSSFSSSANP